MIDDYLTPQSNLYRLFIVRSPAHAAILNQRFREDRKIQFVTPFSCPSLRADVVIWTTDPWDAEYPAEMMETWIDEWVLCRLMPGNHGQIFVSEFPDFIRKVFAA